MTRRTRFWHGLLCWIMILLLAWALDVPMTWRVAVLCGFASVAESIIHDLLTKEPT